MNVTWKKTLGREAVGVDVNMVVEDIVHVI